MLAGVGVPVKLKFNLTEDLDYAAKFLMRRCLSQREPIAGYTQQLIVQFTSQRLLSNDKLCQGVVLFQSSNENVVIPKKNS